MALNAGDVEAGINAVGFDAFAKQLGAASAALGVFENNLKGVGKTEKDTENATQSLMGAMKALGAAAAFHLAESLAESAFQAGQAIRVFEGLGGSMDHLREKTLGMISDADLAKKANLAETMGIAGKDFESMAVIAKAAAAKTGQSVDFMFDSIVTGTARGSKMILDNLGIMVDAEAAYASFAKNVKLPVKALDDLQKKQAFTNQVILQGNKVVAQLEATGVSLVSPFSQLHAAMANAAGALGSMLVPAFTLLASLLVPVLDGISALGRAFNGLGTMGKSAVGMFTLLITAGPLLSSAFKTAAFSLGVLNKLFVTFRVAAGLSLGWVIVAVGALAVAYGALAEAWEDSVGKSGAASVGLVDWFKLAVSTILGAFYWLKDAALFVVAGLAAGIVGLMFDAVNLIVKGPIRLLLSAFEGLFNTVAVGFGAMGLDKEAVIFSRAADALGSAQTDMTKALDTAKGQALASIVVDAPDFKKAAEAATRDVDALGDIIKNAFTDGAKEAAKVEDKKKSKVPQERKPLAEFQGDAGKVSASVLGAAGIGGTLSQLTGYVTTHINDLQKAWRDFFQAQAESIRKAADEAAKAMDGLVSKVRDLQFQARTSDPNMSGSEKGVLEAFKQLWETKGSLHAEAQKANAVGGPVETAGVAAANQIFLNQAAGVLASTKSMHEFNATLALLTDIAKKMGIEIDTAALKFRGTDLAGVLEARVGQFVDKLPKLFKLDGADKKDLISNLSAGLAGAAQGNLDLKPFVSALSTMAMGLPGVGAAVGAVAGGPVTGGAVASAVGAVAAIIPQVVDAIKNVAEKILEAAQVIPQLVSKAVGMVGELIPSDRIRGLLTQAFDPKVIFAAMGLGSLSILSSVLAPFAALMTAVVLPSLIGIAIALSTLVPSMLALAVVVIPTLTAAALFMAASFVVGTAIVATGIAAAVTAVTSALGILAAYVLVVSTLLSGGLNIALMFVAVPAILAASVVLGALALAAAALVATFVGTAALLVVFFKAALDTKSFEAFKRAFEAVGAKLTLALEPFFQGLMPLAGVFDALVAVLLPLAAGFAANAYASEVLFVGFKALAIGLGVGIMAVGLFVSAILAGVYAFASGLSGLIKALPDLQNAINLTAKGILSAVAALADGLLRALGDALTDGQRQWLGGVRNNANDQLASGAFNNAAGDFTSALDAAAAAALTMSPNLDAMGAALADLTGLTYEEAMNRANILSAEKAMSEELTNVPEGFKVTAARFRAIAAQDFGSIGQPAATGTAGQNFYIDRVDVGASNLAEFAGELSAEAERQTFQQTGTTGTRDGQNNGRN